MSGDTLQRKRIQRRRTPLPRYPISFVQKALRKCQQAVLLQDWIYGKQFPISLTSQELSSVSSNHTELELPIVQQEPCATYWWKSKMQTRMSSLRSCTEPSVRTVPVITQGRPRGSSQQGLTSTGIRTATHGQEYQHRTGRYETVSMFLGDEAGMPAFPRLHPSVKIAGWFENN